MCDCVSDSLGVVHREHQIPQGPSSLNLRSVLGNPRKRPRTSISSYSVDELENAHTSVVLILISRDSWLSGNRISRQCRKRCGMTVVCSPHTELAVKERIVRIPPCLLCSSETIFSAALRCSTMQLPERYTEPANHINHRNMEHNTPIKRPRML